MKFEFFEEKNFKQTELGLLPEDWQVVRLGEVCSIKTGTTPSKKNKEFWSNGIIDFIKPPDLQNTFIYTASEKISELARKKARIANRDSILVSCIGIIGRVGYTVKEVAFNQQINALGPKKDNVLPLYLFYVIQTQQKQIESFKSMTTVPIVNKNKFSKTLIPLPPLEEQKAISEVLLAIQTAKEKTEAVIKATKELKKSMMKQLFTYGVYKDASGNWKIGNPETVEVKETEIGIIPKHWQVVRLGELLNNNVILIKFGFPCGKWNNEKKGIAQLRPFNITEDGSIDIENIKYVQTNKDIKSYLIKKDDVIFNNTNSEDLVGKTSLWDREDGVFVISNHMTIIRIKKESILNAVFLAKFLHQKWYEGFYKTICRRHVNQSSISLSRLTTIPIPLPPLEEQKAIADILQTIDEKIQKEEARKKALENLFKSMLNELMSGRLRVRIREGL
ncbi:restriction endonuclease subunit S [Hydrogenobacter thermophilus]|uniref:restriction endonuclease subunit S n=1 Tax=Hydrogenobacter thermophilus TaxID=940 RepID=UPI0030F9DE42